MQLQITDDRRLEKLLDIWPEGWLYEICQNGDIRGEIPANFNSSFVDSYWRWRDEILSSFSNPELYKLQTQIDDIVSKMEINNNQNRVISSSRMYFQELENTYRTLLETARRLMDPSYSSPSQVDLVVFDKMSGKLHCGKFEKDLSGAENMRELCEFMYARKTHEWVGWDEIAQDRKIHHDYSVGTIDLSAKSAIKNAVMALNRWSAGVCTRKIFEWSKWKVRRLE